MNMRPVGVMAMAVLFGIVATLTMDGVNSVASSVGLIGKLNLAFIGKLMNQWLQGQFWFLRPGDIPDVPEALMMGYGAHYFAGISLAIPFYCLICPRVKSGGGLFVGALTYGLACSLISLCFIYPSVGLGFWGMAGKNPVLLIASLANHAVYGVALGGCAIAWRRRMLQKCMPGAAMLH
ncbi:DUF2938 family protein [Serratia marcescens]|uniref:DUF2938 family protein n=1 Tax=Serratia marcescens TaxID=615 RepID=UPI00237F1FA3|nr:DUF2938 family protein [Serratia marcescens]